MHAFSITQTSRNRCASHRLHLCRVMARPAQCVLVCRKTTHRRPSGHVTLSLGCCRDVALCASAALISLTHLLLPFFPPSPASSAADPTADARGGGGGAAPSAADTRGGGGGAIGGEPSLMTA